MANKRKAGLSMEEKCARVEQYLAERRTPFTLKELEAALPKAKGVIFQSVPECLETLVSENRACTDKVGISVLFWNFFDGTEDFSSAARAAAGGGGSSGGAAAAIPKTAEGKRARIELLRGKKQQLQKQLADVQAGVASVSDTPAQAQRRAELLQATKQLRATKVQLEQQLKERTAALAISPQRLRRQFELLQQLVNAWTDNVMLLEEGALRMGAGGGGSGGRAAFRKEIGIEADFDYV
jgi:hypothetical protein